MGWYESEVRRDVQDGAIVTVFGDFGSVEHDSVRTG